jgi:hypothetical protein
LREPAKSPSAARKRYAHFLQLALSCLTPAIWTFGEIDEYSALITSDNRIRLKREGELPNLTLEGSQLFEIVPDERFDGEYRTHTLAYVYTLRYEADDEELISWHWHPITTPDRPYPHLHVAVDAPDLGTTLSKTHMPTGRVSFESVVRFCLSDLAVEAKDDDWANTIGDTEARFRKFSSWGGNA